MSILRLSTILAVALLVLPTGAVAQDEAEATLDDVRLPMASAGCDGPAALAGRPVEGSLTIDGVERTWQMHVPPAHDGVTPVPLVLLLHGLGEDPRHHPQLHYLRTPYQAGFVIVAPLGSGLVTRWMWDLDDTEYDLSMANPDIAFIDALIDHLGDRSAWTRRASTRPATPTVPSVSPSWAASSTVASPPSPGWRRSPTSVAPAPRPAGADARHPRRRRSVRAVRRRLGPRHRQLHAGGLRLVR